MNCRFEGREIKDDAMSFQEKRSIASIISTITGFAIYYYYVLQLYQQKGLTASNDVGFWAAVILISIPVQIVFKIVVHIIFSIVVKITTNEDEPGFTDELDKLIELKGTRNLSLVFTFGFLISMGALVMEMPINVMLNINLFALILGGVVLDISQLYFYRKGV